MSKRKSPSVAASAVSKKTPAESRQTPAAVKPGPKAAVVKAATTKPKSGPAAAETKATSAPAKPAVKKAVKAAAAPAEAPKVKASKPKVPAAKSAPIKLTDPQSEFLKRIHSTGEGGYKAGKKAEIKTIDALLKRKLIKKGAKDKATGAYLFTVSKAGEKHLAGGSGN